LRWNQFLQAGSKYLKIVVISPHRDGAAFSLSLSVTSWLAAGDSVEVLNCFTRSEDAPYSDADSVHANDRMSFVTALRKREDESWRKLCGGNLTITDLGLKDAPKRLHCAADEVFGRAPRLEEKAALKIRAAMKVRAGAAVLPLGLGGHVDHLTARDAALAAFYDAQPHAFYDAQPHAFYEELPYAADLDASAIDRAAAELAERLNCALQPWFAGAEVDVRSAEERKRRFALCYDSQITDDEANKIAQFSMRYQGRERMWVNAAWRQAFPGAT
jgi:LmbE family N-acetylglucosaminyl deacetylase